MNPAIQQINYYVNEAAPETLSQRSAYLTSVFIPWLRRGLGKTTQLVKKNPEDAEMYALHAAYQSGVNFFENWQSEIESKGAEHD